MGTISEKISYLAETKARQKTLINALGGNITNDTPFREYEKELVGVLPKVTGEGTNFSLSPTIEYDLEVDYKGDTSQNTLQGYNLLPLNANGTETKNGMTLTIQNGKIKLNGTTTSATTFYVLGTSSYSSSLLTLQSGTYTATINQFQSNVMVNIRTTSNTLAFTNQMRYAKVETKTFDSNVEVGNVGIYISNNVTLNNYEIELMILSGTYTASNIPSFEPYCGGIPSPNPNYPQDIQVVTGTQEIEVVGKNLFDKSNITSGYRITNQGELVQQTGYYSSDFIKVIPSTKYTKNSPTADGYHKFAFYSTNQESSFISYSNTNTSTTPENCYYIRFCGLSTELDTTQLEVGTNVTTYSPYTSTSYTISLGNIELAKIGTYQDKIYFDNGKWYKTTTIPKTTLTSSMCSSVTASASYGTLCYLNFNGKVDNTNICAMSNKFVGVSYDNRTSLPTGYRIFTSDGSGAVTIRFPNNSTIDTLQEVKDFVDNNVIEVRYVSQNATTTEITNTTLLSDLNNIKENAMSYSGTTNISSSGNLPVIISASAIKQLS